MPISHTIHTGFTVRDLSHMLAFFAQGLGAQVGEIREIPVGDTLGNIIGVPGARARVAMATLPGGHVVELLEYDESESKQVAPRPCDIGAAHLALQVESIKESLRAVHKFGFQCAGKTQYLTGGQFAGRHVTYIRDIHGFTLELVGGP